MNERSFSNKLDQTLKLLDLSNIGASKLLIIDPSYISRLRSGTRIPKSDSELVAGIAQTLGAAIWKKGGVTSMARLMGLPSAPMGEEDFSRALLAWFRDFDEDAETRMMAGIIDSFNGIALPRTTCNKLAIQTFLLRIPVSKKTEYDGITGLQEASTRFLVDACRSKNAQLCLYSDQDVHWMAEGTTFFETWKRLMALCLINGVKVKIIHYIKRDIEELARGFTGWLPLYFLGDIESYCRFDPATPAFSHTIFLHEGRVSIEGTVVRGNEEKGRFRYGTTKADLDRGASSFGLLMEDSQHFLTAARDIQPLDELSKGPAGSVFLSQSTLPLGTMDEALFLDILASNQCSKKDCRGLLEEFTRERTALTKLIQKRTTTVAVFFDSSGDMDQVPVDTHPFSRKNTLSATEDQWNRHLAQTMAFFDREGGEFHLVKEHLFSQIHLFSGEDAVYIQHMIMPGKVFFCNLPSMVQATRTILERTIAHEKRKEPTGKSETPPTSALF